MDTMLQVDHVNHAKPIVIDALVILNVQLVLSGMRNWVQNALNVLEDVINAKLLM
jgi:hypothetical protein